MKTVLAFLFLVISVALAVERPSAAPALTQTNNRKVDPVSSSCCFSFIKRPVPLNLLKSFEHTSESCSVAAVVFLTQRGLKICADPSQSWVQDHIRALSAS
ncbi:C-C motif chemokine 5-like isoform X1 [Pseudonaja textilis]|uniref:C-C motif chemokine 5-like isoform X1 n=1 Tax=Pseudonaja textilis TaxID=8673 RepID=UPI000EA8D601|nr:C-C motif chemokine 5-like isoform X1 [Pseudonaja textilis]